MNGVAGLVVVVVVVLLGQEHSHKQLFTGGGTTERGMKYVISETSKSTRLESIALPPPPQNRLKPSQTIWVRSSSLVFNPLKGPMFPLKGSTRNGFLGFGRNLEEILPTSLPEHPIQLRDLISFRETRK